MGPGAAECGLQIQTCQFPFLDEASMALGLTGCEARCRVTPGHTMSLTTVESIPPRGIGSKVRPGWNGPSLTTAHRLTQRRHSRNLRPVLWPSVCTVEILRMVRRFQASMRDGLTDLSGAGTIPQHTGYDEAPGWISQPGACPFLSSSKPVPLLRHIWPDAGASHKDSVTALSSRGGSSVPPAGRSRPLRRAGGRNGRHPR